jgi:hypothetical protein
MLISNKRIKDGSPNGLRYLRWGGDGETVSQKNVRLKTA